MFWTLLVPLAINFLRLMLILQKYFNSNCLKETNHCSLSLKSTVSFCFSFNLDPHYFAIIGLNELVDLCVSFFKQVAFGKLQIKHGLIEQLFLPRWSILAYEGKLPLTVPQPNAIPSLTMNNEESNDVSVVPSLKSPG